MQAQRNRFQGRGHVTLKSIMLTTIAGRQKKYLNSRRSRMAKTVTF